MLILKSRLLRRCRTLDVAFTRRMPACIPGAFSRGAALSTVEPQIITPFGNTGAPGFYGVAVQIDSVTGQARLINNTDTDAYGLLMRPYPTNSGNPAGNDPLGTSVPPRAGVCDVMVRGYGGVFLPNFAAQPAKKNGIVYVWYAASAGNHVQGGIEASATGGSTLALPDKWYFTGVNDSVGNCEVAVNI